MSHKTPPWRLGDLAHTLGLRLEGDPQVLIHKVGTLPDAEPGDVTFLANPRYRPYLATTRASAVVVAPRVEAPTHKLIADDPYLAYAQLASLFAQDTRPTSQVHPTAVISDTAVLHPSVSVGAHAVVGDHVQLGADVVVGPGCVIGAGARVGAHSCLHANVVLGRQVQLGERVVIRSGAVVGEDGFGFAPSNHRWIKIPQLGSVVIGDDVDVGANTTVDRGAIDDTVIGTGVKIDNQVQVGHNVRIGDHTAIAGCVGIAGSTTLGAHCMVGGGTGFAGHLDIADGTTFTGMSMVTHSVQESGQTYSSGTGLLPNHQWRRAVVQWRRLVRPDKRRGLASSTRNPASTQGDLNLQDILNILPHRYPFLLVDKVLALEPGKRVLALKQVSANEPFFQGHFPGKPVMPGVLILEALAQASGVLAYHTAQQTGSVTPDDDRALHLFVGIDAARFKRLVLPGDALHLEVTLVRARQDVWKFQATARVDEEKACYAELMCARRTTQQL